MADTSGAPLPLIRTGRDRQIKSGTRAISSLSAASDKQWLALVRGRWSTGIFWKQAIYGGMVARNLPQMANRLEDRGRGVGTHTNTKTDIVVVIDVRIVVVADRHANIVRFIIECAAVFFLEHAAAAARAFFGLPQAVSSLKRVYAKN